MNKPKFPINDNFQDILDTCGLTLEQIHGIMKGTSVDNEIDGKQGIDVYRVGKSNIIKKFSDVTYSFLKRRNFDEEYALENNPNVIFEQSFQDSIKLFSRKTDTDEYTLNYPNIILEVNYV